MAAVILKVQFWLVDRRLLMISCYQKADGLLESNPREKGSKSEAGIDDEK